jgi:hypothetical protein
VFASSRSLSFPRRLKPVQSTSAKLFVTQPDLGDRPTANSALPCEVLSIASLHEVDRVHGYSMELTNPGGRLATRTELPCKIRSPCQGHGHEADVVQNPVCANTAPLGGQVHPVISGMPIIFASRISSAKPLAQGQQQCEVVNIQNTHDRTASG